MFMLGKSHPTSNKEKETGVESTSFDIFTRKAVLKRNIEAKPTFKH